MWKGGEQNTKNRGKKEAEAKEKEEEKTEGENGWGRDAELGMDGIGIFPQKKP